MGMMQAPVSVVVFDTELRIAWVNETAERLIGGPPAAGWARRRLGGGLPAMEAGLTGRARRAGVGLRATGSDGEQHVPHALDQKRQRVALRWPADRPAPPEYLRRVWAEFDPARQYHQSLVAGSPVYLPTFGAMTPEQLGEMDSGPALDRILAPPRAGAPPPLPLPPFPPAPPPS